MGPLAAFNTFVSSVTHEEDTTVSVFSTFEAADEHTQNLIASTGASDLEGSPRGQITGHVTDQPHKTTKLRTYFYDVSVQALDTDDMIKLLRRAADKNTTSDPESLPSSLTADQIHCILKQPAADQPWMIAADRFQGGSNRWDWKPELMRLIHVEDTGGCDAAGVYLVASCGDGGRDITTNGILTVFAIGGDELGDPDIFMYGESRDLDEIISFFNEAADGYAVDRIDIDELTEKLNTLI